MKQYTFNKTDKGIYGKAFEMAIKDALNAKDADRVSAQGKTDFRYRQKCYDAKQNATVLQYAPNTKYISGSSRVIYATHIAHTIVNETADTITIEVDLTNTDMFVVDRNAFIAFLLSVKGAVKYNKERGQVNIQTVYNYKKDVYHGRLGRVLEQWCYENDLGDDIIGDILANA